MKKTTLLLALAICTGMAFAQKKTTTSATVKFDATTEKDGMPKAENKTVIAVIDTKAGTVAFESQVKGYTFGNAMMQDHFNGEKWMHSEKFPTATFSGKITNLADVNFAKDGTYTANVEGELTMRGVTKPVKTKATLVVAGAAVNASADFTIIGAEFGIGDAGGKVAKEPKISVSAELK